MYNSFFRIALINTREIKYILILNIYLECKYYYSKFINLKEVKIEIALITKYGNNKW